jgi:cellulose synthase/poly-beta-1,6-N-acetylglucosamine synthase-like glycosyltransferase
VSLLVPMRNEVHRLADALPGILAQPVDEVILLDDCSTDATPEVARRLSSGVDHATVLAGEPTPRGWAGKTWACHQLAAHARSDLLVFCDADVQLAPGAVDAIVDEMDRQQADLFSVFPRQLTDSLGERLVVPLVDDVLLCFLPFPLLSVDVPAAATANGSVMAFDRAAYERLGGFDAVRDELVEDVALARLVRRHRMQLGLALGGELVETRMYTGYAGCLAGFGRGLLPAAGGSRPALVLGALWHLAAYTLPAVLCWRRPRWTVPLLLAVAERLAVEAKTGRRHWAQGLLMPFAPLAAVPVVARALRRTQTWKGRTYTDAVGWADAESGEQAA